MEYKTNYEYRGGAPEMGNIYFKYTVCEVFVRRVRDRGAYVEFVIEVHM